MRRKCKIARYIISWAFIFLIFCLLFGCTKSTPVESAFDDAHSAIVVAKESLPAECKVEKVLKNFELAETKYEKAQTVCESQIKAVQVKYERVLWILFAIIFIFFAKIFIKK